MATNNGGYDLFTLSFNGDFSTGDSQETLTIDFDGAGSLKLNAGAIYRHTMAGLEYIGGSSSQVVDGIDETVIATFRMSPNFLSSVVNDGIMTFHTQNSANVGAWFAEGAAGTDLDYVGFHLEYDGTPRSADVPEPAGITLLALGLLGLLASRRRQARPVLSKKKGSLGSLFAS